jgi:hypothetical protein
MARSWTSFLDDDEQAVVRRVWEQFEVPLYTASGEWDRRNYMAGEDGSVPA